MKIAFTILLLSLVITSSQTLWAQEDFLDDSIADELLEEVNEAEEQQTGGKISKETQEKIDKVPEEELSFDEEDGDAFAEENEADDVQEVQEIDESAPEEIAEEEIKDEPVVEEKAQQEPVQEDGFTEEPAEENFAEEGDGFSDEAEENLEQAEEEIPAEPIQENANEVAPQESIQEEPEQLATSSEAVAQEVMRAKDEPNYELERYLNDIFQNSLKDMKLSPQDWESIAGEKISEQYVIAKGDSLWEISEVLFGSGFFWPKLWQLNNNITNPHSISPGYQLTFIDGSLDMAPQIQGENAAQEAPSTEEKINLTEDELLELSWEEPEIPPAKPTRPALTDIPPSLFSWSMIKEQESDIKLTAAKKAQILENQDFPVTYFFSENNKLRSKGVVREMHQAGANSAASYQYVYLTLEEGGVGDEFHSMKVLEPLTDKDGNIIGYPVSFGGELKVVDTVNAEQKIYKAMITKAFRPIEKDELVQKGKVPTRKWSNSGEMVNIRANIVGARYDSKRKILGLGTVLFLDKGSQHGLQNGQILNVLRNGAVRNLNKYGLGDAPNLGKIRIIFTTPIRATAIVLNSKEEILIGDYTGSPMVVSFGEDEANAEEAENAIDEEIDNSPEFSDEDVGDDSEDDFGDEVEEL